MKKFIFEIQGTKYEVEMLSFEKNIAEVEVNGTQYKVELQQEIKTSKTPVLIRKPLEAPTSKEIIEKVQSKSITKIKAPLPGTILSVKKNVGDTVKKGDVVMIMEAMKMENNVLAERDGIINKINHNVGDSVLQGEALFELE